MTEDAVPNTTTGNVLGNDTNTDLTSAPTLHVSAASGAGITTANLDGSFDVVGAHGTLHIGANGSYTYSLNNADTAVNNLDDGQTLTELIRRGFIIDCRIRR